MIPAHNLGMFEKMVNSSLDVFGTMDRNGIIQYVSHACKNIIGYDSSELVGRHFTSLLHPEDIKSTRQAIEEVFRHTKKITFEDRHFHKEGHIVYMYWSGAWSEDGEILCFVGRDVTEQKLGEQKLKEKEELHRALVEHGSDMLALVDEELKFKYNSDSTQKTLGYAPEQLIGTDVFSLIHPDDIPVVQEKLALVMSSQEHIILYEFRFRHANGEWRWLETNLSNQLSNPAVRALVTSSRDVTERILQRQRLQESEQRFKAIFDDNPDAIFIENREGYVQDANRAAEVNYGLPRHAIINRHFSEFTPPEAVPASKEHLDRAFAGYTTKYTLRACFEGGEKVLEITKIPVSVAGEVVAVHSITKDITAVTDYHNTREEHARKLTTIFESITDAFCTIDRNWTYTYVNSEFERATRRPKEYFVGRSFFDSHPYAAGGVFHQNYQQAMETGNSVHFEAYSIELDLWVSARVFPSEDGLSIYFADITDKIRSQQELQMLSLVANHTTNGVVITDKERRIEWVNERFTRLTGFGLEEAAGKIPSQLLQQESPITYAEVSLKIMNGEPVSFETLNYKKSGEELWLSVQINPVRDTDGTVLRYVIIQTDITERKRAQQELEKLSLVASSTDNGVVITDAGGLTEWVNEGFTKITGYTLWELVGKTPGAVLGGPETDKDTVALISENLKLAKHFTTELINYKKSGEKFWNSMDITPIYNDAGHVSKFIAIQRDITFKKEAEANLLKMTKELYQQNTDLQQFTYIVSHNLRAPVANALGLSKLLGRLDKGAPLYDQALGNLQQSVLQLDNVLRDMNTILSIRDSKATLEKEQVNVRVKVQQALEALQEPLLKSGGEILLDIREDFTILSHRAYLYSIFYNLLSNAIKYRDPERALKVHIRGYDQSGKGTLLLFSDNGSGFDMDLAKDNLFKLYKRFHLNKEGRGIGLYLIKSHLEAMGGHIEVTSRVGVGTSFIIYLPKA